MLLYQTISVFKGAQTMARLNKDQSKPRRNKIIKKAMLPITNGTTKGMFIAKELAIKPKNVVLAKNQKRRDENVFDLQSAIIKLVNMIKPSRC